MIFLFIAVILTVILFLPLKLNIRYTDSLYLSLGIAGFNLPLPSKKKKASSRAHKGNEGKKQTDSKNVSDKTAPLGDRIIKFSNIFTTAAHLTKKHINVDKFIVHINSGTGDAASTAVSVGMLWAIIYNVIALLGNIVIIDNPIVKITPEYNGAVFKTYAKCIISTRIVYIILIGITILLKISRKGKEV